MLLFTICIFSPALVSALLPQHYVERIDQRQKHRQRMPASGPGGAVARGSSNNSGSRLSGAAAKIADDSAEADKDENSKADKVENRKADKVENRKADKVENSKADKVENRKADKVENRKADKVENRKADKVENLKADKVENGKADKVENRKADKVENRKVDKVENRKADLTTGHAPWWKLCNKELKKKLKNDPMFQKQKIVNSMVDLFQGKCKADDPVDCFVLELTQKNLKAWHKAGKEDPKDSIEKGEPKIAQKLWDKLKFAFMKTVSSLNKIDQPVAVELLEELREWAKAFNAVFIRAKNCTVLPTELKDLWKCIKCTRVNGESLWTLDSTTSYDVCIKIEHDMKKESAKCHKDLLELRKNTTLFLSCLHGVSYRAMLATGYLRSFVEKLLLRLDGVLNGIEEDRGNSVFRLLKGRNIGNDEDGTCKNKPKILISIDRKCIFCQDKMWILKDDATFTNCYTGRGNQCGPVCIYSIIALTIAIILIILLIALVIVPMYKRSAEKNKNENAQRKSRNVNKSNEVGSNGSYEKLANDAS